MTTLHTMTIPDDPAELPRWLEKRLVAPDFGQFLAELMALFPNGSAAPNSPLDRWLPVALAQGLRPIPLDVLSSLLKQPRTLLAWQESVTLDGGTYWDDVLEQSDEVKVAFERGRDALERTLAPDPRPKPAAEPRSPPPSVRKITGRGTKIWAYTSTAIAAGLSVAVGLLASRGPDEPAIPKAQIAWGWGKPSGLALDETDSSRYLAKLADHAEEWQLARPSDAASIGIRLAEFRAGCTRLMHSAYGPLPPAEKTWLLEQCRTWAKQLDAHQQTLDAGTDPLMVRNAVDETVQGITKTLRNR